MGDTLGKLETAYNLTKDLLNLRDAVAMQERVFELQAQILAAQREALESNQAQTANINKIRALEEEVARLKAWDAEKERYQLQEASGVLFYVLRPEHQGAEPFHQMCANCFDQGKKSKLQATPEIKLGRRVHLCPLCKTNYAFGHVERPQPINVKRDFDPFTGR